MAVSAFGVEHVGQVHKRDRTDQLGAAAAASGAGAVVAHRAQRDLKRVGPARRVKGMLHAVATGDPDRLAHHLRGATRDVKAYHALGYGKAGLGTAAVGLAGAAVVSASGRRKRQFQ